MFYAEPDLPPPPPPLPPLKKQDMTLVQLKQYDGTGEEGRVCVAVNGKVYDVTKGKRFYGPGKEDKDHLIYCYLDKSHEGASKMACMLTLSQVVHGCHSDR